MSADLDTGEVDPTADRGQEGRLGRVGGVAAFWSIVGGGSTTVWLTLADIELALDPVFYGLGVSVDRVRS